MNLLLESIAIASLIWSFFYKTILLTIFLTIIILYILFINIYLSNNKSKSDKIRFNEYNDTGDPTAFAKLQIPLDDIDEFLSEYNKKNPLKKITYSHIGLKAMGLALKEISNSGKYSFGNLIKATEEEIDVSLLVNIENKNIMNLTVKSCCKNSIKQIASQLKGKIGIMKKNKDKRVKRQLNVLRMIPVFIVELVILLVSFVGYDLGMDFKPMKIKRHNFGIGVVTNIVGIKISEAIPAHVHLLRDVMIMLISNPVVKPFVIDGKICRRKVIKINLAFDPRFGNGDCFLNAINKVKEVWMNPFKYLD